MIRDWRSRFGVGDFPFYIVQLANFMAVEDQPSDPAWAYLREAQMLTAKNVPNSGLATAIDIGEAEDIHPKNKQDVGRRLALNALALTYKQPIEYSGPTYRSMKIEGDGIRLTFDHAAGMAAKGGGALQGFAIAGADKKFVWADARIEGNTVVVSSPQVKQPVAVRYAWANNPLANLYNANGLPAVPFRTDID
jgi:sialate O-acetylesterase